MGCFLLNELGEVLLEISSGWRFNGDLKLEVNEETQSAVLRNDDKSFDIDFVHQELMLPLKKNRYLFVVERSNQFLALHSCLAKVVFVG